MAVYQKAKLDEGGATQKELGVAQNRRMVEASYQEVRNQLQANKAAAQAKKDAAAKQYAEFQAQQKKAAAAQKAQGPTEVLKKVSSGTGGGTTAAKKETTPNVKASGLNTAVKTTSGTVAKRTGSSAYNESADVAAAREAMQLAQQNRPEYQESQAVLDAQAALQSLQNSKPQGYESKYGPALDSLLEQIQNPGKYNYEFNGDNLFKQYSDLYTQQGKQAAMNAMGNAAALTGGYGNSYGQMAANQAYDQYLTELYGKGMELRDRDYEVWLNEQQDKYNQYNLLANADQTDYGRYRDTVSDWQNDRDYAANRYDTERNTDYGRYRDTVGDWENNRSYYTDLYNTETDRDYSRYQDVRNFAEQQYQYDTELKEKIREFDASLNWEKMSTQQKYAAEYCMQVLANGKMPTSAMLKAAGLSGKDAKKIQAQKSSGGGGGGSIGKSSKGLISNGIVYADGKGGFTDAKGKKVNITDYDGNTLSIVTPQNGNTSSTQAYSDPQMQAAFDKWLKEKGLS